MIEKTKSILLVILAAYALCAHSVGVIAAEGGSSMYIPGGAGDAVIALSPEPGLQVANALYTQVANVDRAVLQGAVDLDVDLTVVLDFFGVSYTFEKPVLGGTYTIGAVIPFGYASLDASATGPGGGTVGVSDHSFNLADIAIVPLQLNWNAGNFHFKFAEAIIAPTGAYDTKNLVNLGRNYWAFDTVGAVTWFNTESGTEVSIAPGIMVNLTNDDTDYKTGTEFHVDFTVNQFLSESFALGLRGYYYRQLTADSGSGAILGDFKGESLGLGPGLLWQPEFAKGKLSIVGKVMFDVTATNRFKSTYGSLGAAWKF
jgi:hypothetical protein